MTCEMGRNWRKEVKKLRRKRIRQSKAKIIQMQIEQEQKEKEASLDYQIWFAEQERLEAFKKAEEERIHEDEHEKWLRTELIAQQQWRQLQDKLAKARLERAQQDLRIKKEWEEEQCKLKEAEEKRKRIEEERLRSHQELMTRIQQFISGQGELPSELLVGKETNPEKELCPFFSKTGACRFGDNCSRNHRIPGVSKVLLATNFYSHFGMEHSTPNEIDHDVLLEYDDKDTYRDFEEFFNDVLPEFEQAGKIVQLKVCCNFEKHLRGNTYVEYAALPEAINAYRIFHGRWYGGKQISLQFCDIPSWKRAICGLFIGKRCPKGRGCNFLHVFKNPGNLFNDIENRNNINGESSRDRHRRSRSRSRSKENHWRWSESPVKYCSRENSHRLNSSKNKPRRDLSKGGNRSYTRTSKSSSRSRNSSSSRHKRRSSTHGDRHHKSKRRRSRVHE